MHPYKLNGILLLIACAIMPTVTNAQYHAGTSMEIITDSNTHAQNCYRAATIAARIYYASKNEIENCSHALDYIGMTLHDRAATLVNRGIIYMALDDQQNAIRDYKSALALRPEIGEIHINIGNAYFLSRTYDLAVEEYSSAIEKNSSKSYVAYFNRGMAYENLGKVDNAINDYKYALELFPDWALPMSKLEQLQSEEASR